MSNSLLKKLEILISNRIDELVIDAQKIAESDDARYYKLKKMDQKVIAIKHNFACSLLFLNKPYYKRDKILESVETLYRLH